MMDLLESWGSSLAPTLLVCGDCGWTGYGCDLPVKNWKWGFVEKLVATRHWARRSIDCGADRSFEMPPYDPENYEKWRIPICPACGSQKVGEVIRQAPHRQRPEED